MTNSFEDPDDTYLAPINDERQHFTRHDRMTHPGSPAQIGPILTVKLQGSLIAATHLER
jgi:hypothetical protein